MCILQDDSKVNDLETNELAPADFTVKSPEVASTIVSIVAVCAVFFTVGIIAVIFRKKIYFKKKKDKSDEIVSSFDQLTSLEKLKICRGKVQL